MGYAFISYSSKNQTSANAMRELFNKHNIDTWMAPYDIPAGSEYAEVLYDALTGCSCLVLMLTDVSQNSQWVKKEVNIAITNGKTVVPVKLEDIELNSSMKLYLNDQQIVPVHVIEEKSAEIQKVLNSVIELTGGLKATVTSSKEPQHSEAIIVSSSKTVELVIWSPVNTDVYLNDKKHLVMKIDHNTGFDYQHNSINVSGEFELIFASKGFEKVVAFDAVSIDKCLEYRLNAILSKKEIISSYDRNHAIEQIKEEATAYAYKQLSKVGVLEDIQLLLEELNRLSSITSRDQYTNYLIATCASALGELAIKFDKVEKVKFILQIYENYEAKSSYGYMFEPIVKRLNEYSSRIEQSYTELLSHLTEFQSRHPGLLDTTKLHKNVAVLQHSDLTDLYSCESQVAEECYDLAYKLWDCGYEEDAEIFVRDAYNIWHRLTQETPDNYELQLAGVCHDMTLLLTSLSRCAEATAFCQEKLDIYLYLEQKNPEKYKSDVALAYQMFGDTILSAGGDDEIVKGNWRKALSLYRQMENQNPGLYEWRIEEICHNLDVMF